MKISLLAIIGLLGLGAVPVEADDFFTDSDIVLSPKKLRDLEADRPDATESPRTVDAGRFQIESSVVDYARDRSEGNKFETWTIGETNFKYGLNDSVDLQLIIAPYVREVTRVNGVRKDVEGSGDVTLRLKWNLWGNDEGRTALALFPYIKAPTGSSDISNDEWEGGVIIPWAIDVNDRVGFGLQAEIARVWDDGEYNTDFLHTAVLGVDITARLGAYAEYLGISGAGSYEAYLSTGATWALSDYFQWDAGVVVGLNDAAEDINTFTGFTVKF